MITVVIRMYDKTEKMQSLSYDQSGKILNPTSTVKFSEFHYMNRFIPHFQVMDKAKVEFVDAYEVQDVPGKQSKLIALEPEKIAELKKVLTDKLENKAPAPVKTALEKREEIGRSED